jgi:hypothetical protein
MSGWVCPLRAERSGWKRVAKKKGWFFSSKARGSLAELKAVKVRFASVRRFWNAGLMP